MKGKRGDFNTFYNAQIGCNENDLIGYCDVVTAGNDKAQLIPTIDGIEKVTGQKIETMLADADYGNYESLEHMDTKNITAYVPYRDMNATYDDKPYHSSVFKYHSENDTYICPNNETLKFRRIREDKQRSHRFKQYRTDACKTCEFQKQCCRKGTARRVIEREERQGLKDEIKDRLNSEAGKEIYNRRMHPVESIFGQIKFNRGFTYFLLRGLELVRAEFAIMCLTHNLLKMANYMSYLTEETKYWTNTWIIQCFNAIIWTVKHLMRNLKVINTKTYKSNCQHIRLVGGHPVRLCLILIILKNYFINL